MTIDEAIERLYNMKNKVDVALMNSKREKGDWLYDDVQGTAAALQMAINALEKQIAKKITHPGCYDNEGVWHTWNGIDGVPYDLCPNCKINLCTDGVFGRDKNGMKYCENCGQKLDWSDEE